MKSPVKFWPVRAYKLGVKRDQRMTGTAEIRFWRRDTVFCWSASSPLKIQNTGNFKLVFNVSPVGDDKPQNLERKLKTLSLNFAYRFPLPLHTYIVPKTNCAYTASEFFESFEGRNSLRDMQRPKTSRQDFSAGNGWRVDGWRVTGSGWRVAGGGSGLKT